MGWLHQPREREEVTIVLRPELSARAGREKLAAIQLVGADGRMVPLSALVTFREVPADRSIYRVQEKIFRPLFGFYDDLGK
jgi:multidrug efflux pump subunit AcrB